MTTSEAINSYAIIFTFLSQTVGKFIGCTQSNGIEQCEIMVKLKAFCSHQPFINTLLSLSIVIDVVL